MQEVAWPDVLERREIVSLHPRLEGVVRVEHPLLVVPMRVC